ncbi:MAG: oxidoreductase [Saprospiraceae bacterium]|nr:MAG: oxidoreductase [Saprospiraceae bacterium]
MKNILITGGSKGIGRAIAERFAQAGFNIALVARNLEGLERAQLELTTKFPQIEVLVFAADLGKADEAIKVAQTMSSHWQQVDVVVNNAGLFRQGALLTEPAENLVKMIEVNLYGPYHLTRALRPYVSKHGHIFNICSVASKKSFIGSGSYAVSKHAILGFTRALRLELEEEAIKVTAVMPGATWTSSWDESDIDQNRIMKGSDIAEAIYGAWNTGPSTVVEEIVLRPQLGDL